MCMCAQLLSCLTLCSTMDCILPGSSVCGIIQARILEWVTISSSRWSQPRNWTHISCKSLSLQNDSLPLSHWGFPLNKGGCIFYFSLVSWLDMNIHGDFRKKNLGKIWALLICIIQNSLFQIPFHMTTSFF